MSGSETDSLFFSDRIVLEGSGFLFFNNTFTLFYCFTYTIIKLTLIDWWSCYVTILLTANKKKKTSDEVNHGAKGCSKVAPCFEQKVALSMEGWCTWER